MSLSEQPIDTGRDAYRTSTVVAHDGVRLTTYSTGAETAPALVFVNPLGLSIDLIAPLGRLLGQEYRFITWQARLSPGPDGAPFETDCDVRSYVADIDSVLRHFAVERAAALLGWCSGGEIALRFALDLPERIAALVLISPILKGHGTLSEFSSQNRGVFARVLRRPERVADLARAVNPASTQPDALMARVHTNDLGIAMQIARPFSSGECLLRQALAITSVFGEGGAAIDLDRKLQVPTLAIVGGSDDVVDNAVTERLVRDQEHARLWSEPEGDHYMVSNRPRVIARAVGSFLRQEP